MKLRDLVRCGICGALMAVCSWISLPLGDLAVTMQSFGLFLTLYLLGGSKGTAAFLVYMALGAVGLPVFSGFRGGIGVLLGPTGGYLWGFLLACLLYWSLQRRWPTPLLMMMGQLICYGCGMGWYLCNYAPGGFWAAVVVCVLPYLIPDAVKIFLALYVGKRLKKFV